MTWKARSSNAGRVLLAWLLVACGGGDAKPIGSDVDTVFDAPVETAPDDTAPTDLPADPGRDGDAVDPGPACELSTAGFRVEISAAKPLFVWNLYGDPSAVAKIAARLPEDVKPFFAFQFVPAEPYDFSDAWKASVEAMLAAADAAGLPMFVQVEHGNTRNPATAEYWHNLFEAHPRFLGLVFAELVWSGLGLTGLDDDYMARLAAALEIVAAHGGYVLWQDMADDRPGAWKEIPHVFVKAGGDPGLMTAFRRHGAHLILQDKHNGSGKRFVGPAAAMGFWTSCIAGNWGVNSEDWLWWEAGFSTPFGPDPTHTKEGPDWSSVFSFPDALFGLDWLADLAGGATVFSLEAPFHGFGDANRFSPAFEQVLLPLIRLILVERLIPTRDEVSAKMEVAYQPLDDHPPELWGDELFRGLYGPSRRSLFEWLPSTGRYFYLPILPVLSTAAERARFPEVVDAARWAAELTDLDAKRAFFDARYPAVGEGDAWFVGFPGRWFAFNPNENQDVTATFRFPLEDAGLALSGSFGPHTFAIVLPRADGLDVHLSNYRVDTLADVWSRPPLTGDDVSAYLDGYFADPTDHALRPSRLAVEGLAAKAHVDIEAGPEVLVADRFEDGAHRLDVEHNGPVTLRLRWSPATYGATLDDLHRHPVPDWFRDAKLGIFVHWGVYSVPAWAPVTHDPAEYLSKMLDRDWFVNNPYAEWYEHTLLFPDSPTRAWHDSTYGPGVTYADFAADFEAARSAWDPGAWAASFADLGARYVVLVTKHHDGWTLWPSDVQNPQRTGWHAADDRVGALAGAVRQAGLRFGVYYSGGLDWTFVQGPIESTMQLPGAVPASDAYAAYSDAQIRELVARYQPSILWNDIAYPKKGDRLGLFADFYNAVPEGVVNDRWANGVPELLLGSAGDLEGLRKTTHFDYVTPEYSVLADVSATPFETTRGIGWSFGYNRQEEALDAPTLLSPEALVETFVDIVSKNGNLILNVGPRADGSIPESQRLRLEALQGWLEKNGGAIFGTRPWVRAKGTVRDDDAARVRFTWDPEGALYVHLLDDPAVRPVVLADLIAPPGMTVTRVAGGAAVPWLQQGDDLSLDLPELPEAPVYVLRLAPEPFAPRH
jgi:alpha-L-fucosidase